MPAACIVTLGCPKNEADSDVFAGCLESAGWTLTPDPANAVLLLLNTCAFIAPAVEESLEALEEALRWKEEVPGRRLVLAGCLPGRFEDDGSGGLDGIDLVIGPADITGLARFLGAETRCGPVASGSAGHRYLKISEGCSNGCAYCTVPLIRGPRRDRGPEDIFADAERLVLQGAAEIGLVGQDTAAWEHGGRNLSWLVRELASAHPSVWFRLYYIHPAHMPDDLPEAVKNHNNIMPYIDMPVQHVSDRVLRRMGRGYTSGRLEEIFERFDRMDSPLSVRVTVIAGYPGETEEDFSLLEDFIREHRCIRTVAAFPYWPEEGTEEFRRTLPGELPDASSVQSRLARIGDAAEVRSSDWGERLEGLVMEVLADSPSEGHSRYDAPSVDGACIFDRPVPPGSVVRCRVAGWFGPDLEVEVQE